MFISLSPGKILKEGVNLITFYVIGLFGEMKREDKYDEFNLDLRKYVSSDSLDNSITDLTNTGCTCVTGCLPNNTINNCISETCSACHSYCGGACV